MKNVKKTRLFAEQIRRESLRAMSVIKTGHVGGCMSLADTLAPDSLSTPRTIAVLSFWVIIAPILASSAQ